MNIDCNREQESPDEDKRTEDGILGETHSSIQISELKVDTANQIEKHGATSGLQCPGVLELQPQQQTQGTVVCWESFLHVRSIRVLLVENDDSTRHVVSALLRNCNYEVLEAANGLQAWKILENLNNHVDIVLAEVVMPCFSGIGLLCKIMSHKTRKNIPVIMMSSHDSMGLVFKCLSKGAVDFLVKPIRKNELKNLWQHVWRRCHSSSGSGSESGTQSQKSVKSKGSEKLGNSASDDGENDVSNGLNVGDGSDEVSGAQSSWTKQAVEIESSQALSPMDRVAERQDSTRAQVIRSNAEYSDNKKLLIGVAREGHGQKWPETVEIGKDLESIVHRNVEPKSENLVEVQPNSAGGESESPREVANELVISNNATDERKEANLELSLKRLRVQDTGRSHQDERYVLRRSQQSAFSRYNTCTNIFGAPNGITESDSLHDNGVEVARRESVGDMQVYSTELMIYQSSNGVSNHMESEATSVIDGVQPSASRPVKNDLKYSQQQFSPLPSGIHPPDLRPVRDSDQQLRIQHPHLQNYHHHHNNHFHSEENQQSPKHDESSLKKLAAHASHCGSTNVLGGPMDGNPRNYSLNRSASGSNHGSYGQNGNSTAIYTVVKNAESDVGQAGKSGSGSGDASGSGSGNRVNENKLAQREAALIKFRQKRKERCFKKRVRYQNRKKLAEQRPRVRGQFVKQSATDSSNRTEDE